MSAGTGEAERHAAAEALAHRVVAGERAAIARALTEMERLSALAPPLVAALEPRLGGALVAGLTGPPGAGKSTLVNALIASVRAAGRRVGVLAVDPSSPVSGGAILGDRIRMTAAHADDGVFVRSLASRGHLGGLSPAAVRMIDVLDAAGFDLILVETVGTGQSEIDVAEIADVRVVLAAPGLGDGIQAMKSGILEIADFWVVNKADDPRAEETRRDLYGALSLVSDDPGLDRRILLASAKLGQGVSELLAEVDAHTRAQDAAGERDVFRRERLRRRIERTARAILDAGLDPDSPLAKMLVDEVQAGRLGLGDAAKTLIRAVARDSGEAER